MSKSKHTNDCKLLADNDEPFKYCPYCGEYMEGLWSEED